MLSASDCNAMPGWAGGDHAVSSASDCRSVLWLPTVATCMALPSMSDSVSPYGPRLVPPCLPTTYSVARMGALSAGALSAPMGYDSATSGHPPPSPSPLRRYRRTCRSSPAWRYSMLLSVSSSAHFTASSMICPIQPATPASPSEKLQPDCHIIPPVSATMHWCRLSTTYHFACPKRI